MNQFTKILMLAFVFTFLSEGCKKNDNDQIPLVAVDITIYLSNPDFIRLTTVSGWEYVTGGSRGIVVYRYSQDEFRAFERHCPYQPKSSCGQIAVDSTNITTTDACCGSQFLIVDGSVTKGPANQYLKQYQTNFDGSVVRIYN